MHINRAAPSKSRYTQLIKIFTPSRIPELRQSVILEKSCSPGVRQKTSMAEQVNHNSIETLIGSNYSKWREDVEIALGLLDYEIAIEEDAPAKPDADASVGTKAKYAKWIKANKMAILIMRRSISPSVRGSITSCDNAKKFIDSIGEKFRESEKVEIGTLTGQLTDTKYNGERCVRTHILNMLEIGNKLKALKVNVDETMMVHFAINSLPSTLKHLRSTYVAQKEKWTVTDLISICVQEEHNMKKDKAEEKINMVQNSFKRDFGKGKDFGKKNKGEKETKGLKPEGLKCYFCKKFGHMKRNCDRYKRWLDKQKAKGVQNKEATKQG